MTTSFSFKGPRPSMKPTLKMRQTKPPGGKDEPEQVPEPWREGLTLISYDFPRISSLKIGRKEKVDHNRVPMRFDLPGIDEPSLTYSPNCRSFEIKNSRELTEEVLNIMIPPKRWQDPSGLNWVQMVSQKSATRAEVVKLAETFERILMQGKAKEVGIDHFRRKIFTELFDELIRQCTIECAEHGMLLFRVRNEIQMTFRAYESLYESGSAYAVQKALIAQEEEEKRKKQDEEDAIEIEKLEAAVRDLKQKLKLTKKHNAIKWKINRTNLKEEYNAKKEEMNATKMAIWSVLFPRNVAPVT